VDPSKFKWEHDIVERFVRELGYTRFSLTDPNFGQKADTGADVLLNAIRSGMPPKPASPIRRR